MSALPETVHAGAANGTAALRPSPLELAPREAPLELRGVTKSWGSRRVLDGVDLELQPGASAWLHGANGTGKTTLLRIAAGVILPERGEVRAFAGDPRRTRGAYYRRLGVLSAGDRGIYARLTVRQNLDFWARIALLPKQDRSSAIARSLERFGLEPLAERRADRLSMGQRQRVRLGLTFLHDPELLLLDEPRNSLDAAGIAMLASAVRDTCERGGAVLCCSPTGENPGVPLERAYELVEGRLSCS